MAVISRASRVTHRALIALTLWSLGWVVPASADCVSDSLQVVSDFNTAISAVSSFGQNGCGSQCDTKCNALESAYSNGSGAPPNPGCLGAFTQEFNQGTGQSDVTARMFCFDNTGQQDPLPDCESMGLVEVGGACVFSDDPQGPTDEDCQERTEDGPQILGTTGPSLEEAGAVYLDSQFGGAVTNDQCGYTPSAGPDTGGGRDENGNPIGPDLDVETEGIQNCMQSNDGGVNSFTCLHFYDSPGVSDPAQPLDNVNNPNDNAQQQRYDSTIEHNDGTSTDYSTERDFTQVDPNLTQDRSTTTQTNRDDQGNVTDSIESETTTLRYSDGSTTVTTRTTTRDANGNVIGTEVSGTSRPGGVGINDGEEGEEGESNRLASGGGTCGAPPTCSGDQIDCKALEVSWLSACGFENSVAEAITQAELVDGTALDGGELSITDEVNDLFNSTGFLSNRSCPTAATVSLGVGNTLSFDFAGFCDLAVWLSGLILAFAAYRSVRIMLGALI